MWAEAQALMNRGAVGKLCLVSNPKVIQRADIITNGDVIGPILKFLGTRVTVHNIREQVELFFAYARPRGKPPIEGHLVATAAKLFVL